MDRIDLSAVPSSMEETARAWGASVTPPPRALPRSLTPRAPLRRPFADRCDRGEAGFYGQQLGPGATVSDPRHSASHFRPATTREDHAADAFVAREEFLRHIATGIPDPREKGRLLTPAEAEAMVSAEHDGNNDLYLRADTDPEVASMLFAIGCVGKRGADRRLWLGPYGTKVRKALIGGDE